MSEPFFRRFSFRDRLILGAVLGSILAVGLIATVVLSHAKEPTKSPASAPEPVHSTGAFRPTKSQLQGLTIVPVGSVSFQAGEFTDGSIAANDDTSTPVFSPLSGRVSAVIAKLGDVVAKGAPLIMVEASEFVQGQSDLVSASGAVNSAEAQVKLATSAEQRQHELLLARAGAQKDWLQSQSDLAAAQSTLKSAQIALDAARNRLGILGKAPAEIKTLEASPGKMPMNPNAAVRSPIAGTIIQRQVALGQYIQSAAAGAGTPVFVVANLSSVWLIANVRESDAAKVRVGQPVAVHVPALPGQTFSARLNWVAASLDPNTHRLSVRAQIDNREGALKPMMFANFQILTGSPSIAAGIPQEAIVYEGPDAHVFVAENDGGLALRPIHTGRVSGDVVEVTEGLSVGEKVVTRGALFIDRATESK